MITIKNISMHYGPTVALDNISFSVGEGEILGLLGPNGAGKSTLMKILTTFIHPSHGTAEIGGHDILNNSLKVREMVGYLPENVPLYMDMRVDEYLAFVGKARGISGTALEKRFKWLCEACGITSVWKHAIYELAKGFNNFYQGLPILKDVEAEVTAFRLNLSNETGKVVQSSMLLLGIELPERM